MYFVTEETNVPRQVYFVWYNNSFVPYLHGVIS